jgi:hypothetical protein
MGKQDHIALVCMAASLPSRFVSSMGVLHSVCNQHKLEKVPNSKFDVTLIPETTPKTNTYHTWRVATWSTWRTHLASKCRCTLHSAQAIPYTDQSLRAAAQSSAIWCHVLPVQHSTALSPTHSLRPCCLPGIPQGAPVHQHTHSFNGMRVFP